MSWGRAIGTLPTGHGHKKTTIMEYYKKCGYDIQDGKAIIPEGETEIKDQVFRDCKEITEITLLEWMEEIGEYEFYGCKNLKSIILPR